MKQLEFPELRQTYEWDCGAKSLQAVLKYYGVEISEELLIRYAKTNSREGTSIKKIQDVLKKFDLKFEAKEMTIDNLKDYIDREIPVIILLQAWKDSKEIQYKNDFNDGHWVVVIGYDFNKIIFEDPYSLQRTFLENKELEERWHAKEKNNKIFNYGIAVFGKKQKYNPDEIIHMD